MTSIEAVNSGFFARVVHLQFVQFFVSISPDSYFLTQSRMTKFMQILLASFGVMALMLAGCTPSPKEDTTMDGTTMEEPAMSEDSSSMEVTPVTTEPTTTTTETK